MEQAERTLVDSDAPIKHVIVLSDGKVGGTLDMYYSLVASMHHDIGATISTIAIGKDADFSLLEGVSKYGGGGYFQTDSAKNLPQIFLEDFKQHGGDVTMVETQFTPHTTSAQRGAEGLRGTPAASAARLCRDLVEAESLARCLCRSPGTARSGYRELEVQRGQDTGGHHRREWAMVGAVDRARQLRAGVGSHPRVDDARDRRGTEDRRRARISGRADSRETHRLQRPARIRIASGDGDRHASRWDQARKPR